MTNQWTVEELYNIYQNDQTGPYLEIVDDYEIIVTDRMALVKADAVISWFGVPGKRESTINNCCEQSIKTIKTVFMQVRCNKLL